MSRRTRRYDDNKLGPTNGSNTLILVAVIVVTVSGSLASPGATLAEDAIAESPRVIQVVHDVDVVVVGGTTSAVAAAAVAADAGATVFLAAPRPYLGEDVCATGRLWLEPRKQPSHPLARRLFKPGCWSTPMHVKRTLDRALLDAGVAFLYGCLATDVLRDDQGRPAGIIIANRAGRQAVIAEVIIDATDRATVARLAGTAFRPYPKGPQVFRRVIVGGKPASTPDADVRPVKVEVGDEGYPVHEVTLRIAMADGRYRSFAEAEQRAIDATFDPNQVDASEFLFQVPPDSMHGRKNLAGKWPGAEKAELDCFRPMGVDRLYVLSGCADVDRDVAEQLARTGGMMEIGDRIGAAAAAEARATAKPHRVQLPSYPGNATNVGDVREPLGGVRPVQEGLAIVRSGRRTVPVLGRYDVVVIGGGTSGAPAGIAAARNGAKTLIVEYLHGLGGLGTIGMVSRAFMGNRCGFYTECLEGEKTLSAAVLIEGRREWLRRQARSAGAEIWTGVLGCGAVVRDGQVVGAVVVTPDGRGVVLAKVIIDATGNADIAAAAGAECISTVGDSAGVQGAGLPARDLGVSLHNTDFTLVDDADVVDRWRLYVYAKEIFGEAYDLGQLPQTRERRRIVGDAFVTPIDILNGRTYPDTIVQPRAYFDNHGYRVHPLVVSRSPGRLQYSANVPYRCLLPKNLDGLLVIGIGLSAHRDAMGVLRMQPDMQNQGYAAGLAAAMAARAEVPLRRIDVRMLQQRLVAEGILTKEVPTQEDSYPIPTAEVASSVEAFLSEKDTTKAIVPLARILGRPDAAKSILRTAHEGRPASDPVAIRAAEVLALLGDTTGAPTLVQAIEVQDGFDEGHHLKSLGDIRDSRMDSLIIALGRTQDRRALPALLRKIPYIRGDTPFSHIRAMVVALESLGDPTAAPALAKQMTRNQGSRNGQPVNMLGNAVTSIEDARRLATRTVESKVYERKMALRELLLARALYRCGDHDGLGERVLREYARDLRGHLARHAQAVLKQGPGPSPPPPVSAPR
jgi:ribulose 1,5-bisphosphate synthetase/thiazole synthase/HEAT repeat protein